MRPEHYVSAEAFRTKIMLLAEEAVAEAKGLPTLLAFPELIGFPLLIALENPAALQAKTVAGAALDWARRAWPELLGTVWRRRVFGPQSFFLARALPAWRVYKETFAEAARTFGVTINAGSSFLPHIEEEAMRGTHIADGHVYNTSFTFGPTGTLLRPTRKCYLTSGAEMRSGLSRARVNDFAPVHTPVGRLGVAICLDAFYSSVLAQLDGMGTQIVVQPSANAALWDRRWPGDTNLSEGEAWLTYGLRAGVQNRLHICYGVNPMLVADLWDLSFRGRSSIVANTRFQPGAEMEDRPGLVAIAPTAEREAWVRASVEHPSKLAEVAI